MDTFSQLIINIVRAQENVIGPIAIEQAKKVDGLSLDWSKHTVEMNGDKKNIVDQLVKQYEHLFGRASLEVCKDAVKSLIGDVPKDQLPQSLAS